ncbi:junctional adhesion molecule-like isoform X1 [Labrus bergylta]|uniref:junctional adhesion molecule-like isoform X1 n=1 Tax=Labrus bergylta TaxID=56723 RepID=UPI0033140CC2
MHKMAHVHPQGLLMLVLFVVISECSVVSPVSETVAATLQEDVVLPCFISNLTDPKSCYRIKWMKNTSGANQKVILARPKTTNIRDAERVKWETNGRGETSLILTKLQKSDEGVYTCEICKGWACSIVKNITLIVKQCKSLTAMKEPPGKSVNLNCHVNMTSGQQGPLKIFWQMLKGDNPVNITSKAVGMNGRSLTIQSVNSSDSGWYRCKYMLGQTQRCFEIKLQVENVVVTSTSPATITSGVHLETRNEGNSGVFIAVIVSSVIIGIAIIFALILLAIYCRRKTQRAAQQTQRHLTGLSSPEVMSFFTRIQFTNMFIFVFYFLSAAESNHLYEFVTLTLSEDPLHQRVNSFYQSEEDGLHSFCY